MGLRLLGFLAAVVFVGVVAFVPGRVIAQYPVAAQPCNAKPAVVTFTPCTGKPGDKIYVTWRSSSVPISGYPTIDFYHTGGVPAMADRVPVILTFQGNGNYVAVIPTAICAAASKAPYTMDIGAVQAAGQFTVNCAGVQATPVPTFSFTVTVTVTPVPGCAPFNPAQVVAISPCQGKPGTSVFLSALRAAGLPQGDVLNFLPESGTVGTIQVALQAPDSRGIRSATVPNSLCLNPTGTIYDVYLTGLSSFAGRFVIDCVGVPRPTPSPSPTPYQVPVLTPTNCSWNPSNASLSPCSGPAGTTLTIKGPLFGYLPSLLQFEFGGKTFTVPTTGSAKSFQGVVPQALCVYAFPWSVSATGVYLGQFTPLCPATPAPKPTPTPNPTPPPMGSLSIVRGNPQINKRGKCPPELGASPYGACSYFSELAVRLVDKSNKPISGSVVTFWASDNGSGDTSCRMNAAGEKTYSRTTDKDGVATASAVPGGFSLFMYAIYGSRGACDVEARSISATKGVWFRLTMP